MDSGQILAYRAPLTSFKSVLRAEADRRAANRRSEASALRARPAVRPFDDPVRPKFGREVGLTGRNAAAHRDAGLVHAIGGTGNERMPVEQVPPFGDQPIGASDREPAQFAHCRRSQFHAVGNPTVTLAIVEAMAGLGVEQLAADVGEMDRAVIFVLELDKAAAAAA